MQRSPPTDPRAIQSAASITMPITHAQPALQLQGIGHFYGTTVILRDLNLVLSPGEYCVVLGKSGGGKSTLLRMIAGLLGIGSGTAVINGNDVGALEPKDRDVGMLFQDDRLYPHWSIRRTLEMADRRSPLFNARENAVDSIAKRFTITDILDRRPDQVSGGQLRRAALAKVMLRRPAIALLDEPLHGLDAGLRDDFIGILEDFPTDRGDRLAETAIVHVTHDGDEAMRLADRIAVLESGTITQIDSPSEIYRRPKSLAVASALGQPPANQIRFDQLVDIVFDGREELRVKHQAISGNPWVLIRPESIVLFATQASDMAMDRIAWKVQWVSTRFVAGRWLSRWRSGDHIWVSVTQYVLEPMQNKEAEVTLTVAFEDLIWVN